MAKIVQRKSKGKRAVPEAVPVPEAEGEGEGGELPLEAWANASVASIAEMARAMVASGERAQGGRAKARPRYASGERKGSKCAKVEHAKARAKAAGMPKGSEKWPAVGRPCGLCAAETKASDEEREVLAPARLAGLPADVVAAMKSARDVVAGLKAACSKRGMRWDVVLAKAGAVSLLAQEKALRAALKA